MANSKINKKLASKGKVRASKEADQGRSRGKGPDEWFDDEAAVASPDYGIPELRAQAKKRKRLANLLKVSVVAGPLAFLLGIFALGFGAQALAHVRTVEAAPMPELAVQEITSPGRFAATQALETWLATVPNPLPGGRIVSWDGATELEPRESEQAASGQLAVTLEHFTVTDGVGTSYRVSYQIGSDLTGGGAAVLAGPSLQARPQPATGLSVKEMWPGLRKADVTGSVSAAVQAWADAYTSGDPDRLHLAVGDADANRTYVAISGVERVETEVTLAGRTDAQPTAATEEVPAERLIVRAAMAIGWEGRDSEPSDARIEMDLLILRADTGAPQVVAWGAPGTGPELVPYGNAVPNILRAAPGKEPGDTRYDDSGTAPEEATVVDGTETGDDATEIEGPSLPGGVDSTSPTP